MTCKLSWVKVIFALLNAVLSVLGVGLIALSVYELNSSTPGTVTRIAIVVQIFVGSFVILTSFVGCYGTCRESMGLTWSYAICVLILLAFQIYIIIAAHATDYAANATSGFNALWGNYSLNSLEIAETEQRYQCCGRVGSKDYTVLDKAIPKNCYMDYERSSETLFTDGCLLVLQRHAVRNAETGLMIKWILFFVELLTVASTGLLGINIRNKQRREQFGH